MLLFQPTSLISDLVLFQQVDVDFYIDIHAHSTLTNGFMYGNVYDDPVRYEKQCVFPKLMCANADDFSMVRTIETELWVCGCVCVWDEWGWVGGW